MIRLLLSLVLTAYVTARPELYKEKEDFQFSRSSSDEGTKSGYYDAQRGNMGGNYERAHNMDALAQHQMGGLVTQVDGEVGDTSQTKAGNVFTSANSRGVFGSGHYDLSRLQGRNFQEGATYGNTHSSSGSTYDAQSSASSQQNSRYSSRINAANSDYRGYHQSNADAATLYGANQYQQGLQRGHESNYRSHSEYDDRNLYQQGNLDYNHIQGIDGGTHNRLISTVPVKVYVRPGQRIAIPLATQTHSGSHLNSYYDRSSANVAQSEAEVLNSNVLQENIKPTNDAKHYESSYSYRKQWEKHDSQPSAVFLAPSTVAPISQNSEVYDLQSAAQYNARRLEQQANYNAGLSQSQYHSEAKKHSSSALSSSALSSSALSSAAINSAAINSAALNSHSNMHSQSGSNSDVNAHLLNQYGDLNSKPKSYQSSYSYHKSWERQGDPYIIKPASNGIYESASGKLTDLSDSQDSYDYKHARNQQSRVFHSCVTECEPTYGRVVRSYDLDQAQLHQQSQNLEDLSQQSQNLEDLSQQSQNLEDFGQQSQNLEAFGQASQNLEDFGQQSQNLEDFGQQSQNLEHFGQQSETKWEHADHLDDFRNQNHFGILGKVKPNSFENLDQQVQSLQSQSEQQHDKWTMDNAPRDTEDLTQQSQHKWVQTGNTNENGQTLEVVNKKEYINTESIQHPQSSNNFDWFGAYGNHDPTIQNYDTFHHTQEWHRRDGVNNGPTFHSSDIFSNTKPIDHNQMGTSSSLNNLWNKLDNLDGDSSIQNNENSNADNNYFSHNSHSYQSWQQHTSNTNFQQNNQNNYFEHNKFNKWLFKNDNDIQSETNNEESDAVAKPTHVFPTTTSTEKARELSLNPSDVGRGDIGAEDLFMDMTSTEKSNNDVSFSIETNKQYKTPDEIEALSLTKTDNSTDNLSDDQNVQENKEVVKLNKDEDRDIESSAQKFEEIQQNKLSQTNSGNFEVNENALEQEPQELENLHNFFNNNKHDVQSKFWTQESNQVNTENFEQETNQHLLQKSEKFDEQSEAMEQQVDWGFEQHNQEQKDQDDFSQKNLNPSFEEQQYQQHDFSDYQKESSFYANEYVHGSLDKVKSNYEKSVDDTEVNQEPEHTEELYKESSYKKIYKPNIDQDPKSQNLQNVIPLDVITEKPGFWKSIGNKFTSAKSKVASWFKSET